MNNEKTSSIVPKLFLAAGMAAGAALLAFTVYQWRFYFSSLEQQPLHPHFEFLRSSGRAGLSFGLIGAALMLLNLSYLVRKSLIHISWLGPLRHWMAFHVFTGMLGGGLVLLHSAFHTRSAVGGLAFWSMMVVIVTGLIGRYIYARVPRSLEGKELELDELSARLAQYRNALIQLGLPADLFQYSPMAAAAGEDRGIVAAFLAAAAGDREGRQEFRLLRKTVRKSESWASHANEILSLARRFYREREWFKRYHELRSLMSSWRFLHRWFAITLVVAMGFHIFLAIRLADLWILR